jgi:tRNA A37 threonylcarbamoyltransferase TsaD
MTAIARALSRAFPATNIEVETLKTIALFCGVGLVFSLLLAATTGLDMSAGFF